MNLQEIVAKIASFEGTISALSAKVEALEAAKAEAADLSSRLAASEDTVAKLTASLEAAKAETGKLTASLEAAKAETTASIQGFSKTLLALQPSGDSAKPEAGDKSPDAAAGDATDVPVPFGKAVADHILSLLK